MSFYLKLINKQNIVRIIEVTESPQKEDKFLMGKYIDSQEEFSIEKNKLARLLKSRKLDISMSPNFS